MGVRTHTNETGLKLTFFFFFFLCCVCLMPPIRSQTKKVLLTYSITEHRILLPLYALETIQDRESGIEWVVASTNADNTMICVLISYYGRVGYTKPERFTIHPYVPYMYMVNNDSWTEYALTYLDPRNMVSSGISKYSFLGKLATSKQWPDYEPLWDAHFKGKHANGISRNGPIAEKVLAYNPDASLIRARISAYNRYWRKKDEESCVGSSLLGLYSSSR